MSIGINGDKARGWSTCGKLLQVKGFMDPLEGLFAHGLWFSLFEGCKLTGFFEMSQDRLRAFRPFRMSFMHLVPVVGGVGKEGEHD